MLCKLSLPLQISVTGSVRHTSAVVVVAFAVLLPVILVIISALLESLTRLRTIPRSGHSALRAAGWKLSQPLCSWRRLSYAEDHAVADISDPLSIRYKAEGRRIYKYIPVLLRHSVQEFLHICCFPKEAEGSTTFSIFTMISPAGSSVVHEDVIQLDIARKIMRSSLHLLSVFPSTCHILLKKVGVSHIGIDQYRLLSGLSDLFPEVHRHIGFSSLGSELTIMIFRISLPKKLMLMRRRLTASSIAYGKLRVQAEDQLVFLGRDSALLSVSFSSFSSVPHCSPRQIPLDLSLRDHGERNDAESFSMSSAVLNVSSSMKRIVKIPSTMIVPISAPIMVFRLKLGELGFTGMIAYSAMCGSRCLHELGGVL